MKKEKPVVASLLTLNHVRETVNLLSIVDLLLGDEPTNILNPLSGRHPFDICAERGLSFIFGHLISEGADPSFKSESSGYYLSKNPRAWE